MTALTAATIRDRKPGFEANNVGQTWPFPVKASTTIYQGALVGYDSSGYIIPASRAAVVNVLGVAIESVDNSSGSNGDKNVTVQMDGVFKFDMIHSTTLAVTNTNGAIAYVYDDNTICITTAVASTTANNKCGIAFELISATDKTCWMKLVTSKLF